MNITGRKQPWDTPCNGTCSTTMGGLVCRGCSRTVEEIRDWPALTREQRIQINQRNKGLSQLVQTGTN